MSAHSHGRCDWGSITPESLFSRPSPAPARNHFPPPAQLPVPPALPAPSPEKRGERRGRNKALTSMTGTGSNPTAQRGERTGPVSTRTHPKCRFERRPPRFCSVGRGTRRDGPGGALPGTAPAVWLLPAVCGETPRAEAGETGREPPDPQPGGPGPRRYRWHGGPGREMSGGTGGRAGSDGSRSRDPARPPPRCRPGRLSPPLAAPLGPDHFLVPPPARRAGRGGRRGPRERGRRRRVTAGPGGAGAGSAPAGDKARAAGTAHRREAPAAPQGSRRSIAGRGGAGGEARSGRAGAVGLGGLSSLSPGPLGPAGPRLLPQPGTRASRQPPRGRCSRDPPTGGELHEHVTPSSGKAEGAWPRSRPSRVTW